MIDGRHPTDSLGAYVLDTLDEVEAGEVADHLVGCAECRGQVAGLAEVKAALDDVPSESLLDGPPEHGDLMLQRTLRQVRRERRIGVRTRNLFTSAGVVVAVAVALGGGLALAEANESTSPSAEPPVADVPEQPIASMLHLHGARDGMLLTVTVAPADGWVRVSGWVAGLPVGQKCRLVVVSKAGRTEVAGSWLASREAATVGMTLDGAALVSAEQVRSVEVQDFAGHTFVSASR
ncbi:MAG TPA: zf-HC2 domain-containing protein [Pseudonocardiaceae bacterium]|jgi:RNA polymerase sigma-70 factor (ECF subfamily)|nr:zf-HC2 domain-containing protein [Pseudonocardiaceae bacterium]